MKLLRFIFFRFRIQISNFTAFTALQVVAQFIPIVTIPYFVRVLGIESMGLLAIATAVALSASVLMDYAIQLSGTRFSASHSENRDALNSYLNISSFSKIIILLPIMGALFVSRWLFPLVFDHFSVFFWSLLASATLCLFPQWLFQGLLAMPTAARIMVSSRIGSVILAALLIREPKDVFIIPMMQALCGSAALIITAKTISQNYKMTLSIPQKGSVKKLFKENWNLFSATIWGAAYSHGAIIIMSTMLSTSTIGFFSIGQKISQGIVAIFNVAAQTAFPYFVRTRANRNLRMQVQYYMAVVIFAASLALLTMFVFRQPVYDFFAAQNSSIGLPVFEIWIGASLFTIISVSLNPIMIALHFDLSMARVYRYVGLAFMGLAPLVCAFAGGFGMAASILVTEMIIASYCVLSVKNALGEMARNHGS